MAGWRFRTGKSRVAVKAKVSSSFVSCGDGPRVRCNHPRWGSVPTPRHAGSCSCPHAPSHLVQVNRHLVRLHLHLLHQLLPLQLEGHSSGWATAARWVPQPGPTPRVAAPVGQRGVPGAAGASHLHHRALVRDVARRQLGLDDSHVGGRTLPGVPAKAEPRSGVGVCPPSSAAPGPPKPGGQPQPLPCPKEEAEAGAGIPCALPGLCLHTEVERPRARRGWHVIAQGHLG